jgi:ankyrin repeat protein
MEHICGRHPADLEDALAELPETLDGTYVRMLRGIQEADWAFAHRVFQFVAAASRPLRVEELAELFTFNFKAGSIPEFHEDWRRKNPADAILSACSTLLSIVDGGSSLGNIIQFSHFSVKEFLTSTRLAKAADAIPRRYHIAMTPAHTLAARSCFGILLHLDQDVITRDSLEDFPLAEYAAEHWASHALFEGVSHNVVDGIKQLFDQSKPHLAVCVWICDPAVPTWRRKERGETPLPLCQTSLHYAASWGLHPIVGFLIIELSQHVSSRRTTDDATPLHLALRNGHVKAACRLVEWGADLTARNKSGETPLSFALSSHEVGAARMLIKYGADVTTQDNDGWTPLHHTSYLGELDVTRILIERGADLTAQTYYGKTPLHLASQEGQVGVVRILFEHGACATAQDEGGETPLHLASEKGQVDVVRMLIERGADVTALNNDGDAPLHLVSTTNQTQLLQRRYAEVTRILLEHGAEHQRQEPEWMDSTSSGIPRPGRALQAFTRRAWR